MRTKSVVPDGVAYNTMIGGFCKIKEIEMAVKFFKEMGLCGIENTCVAYEHYITGGVNRAVKEGKDGVEGGRDNDGRDWGYEEVMVRLEDRAGGNEGS
ncbi:hypothetical protein TB2_034075 [Malus domestica]